MIIRCGNLVDAILLLMIMMTTMMKRIVVVEADMLIVAVT